MFQVVVNKRIYKCVSIYVCCVVSSYSTCAAGDQFPPSLQENSKMRDIIVFLPFSFFPFWYPSASLWSYSQVFQLWATRKLPCLSRKPLLMMGQLLLSTVLSLITHDDGSWYSSILFLLDHVYLQPEHLGECYYIGRVMEFCGGNAKRRGLQARIAWYNRPKDVMGGRSYDPRLLVATMHSDLNPVSSIRGKCTVTHKHYIPRGKLEQYKKQDNHFYYHQLYDRYMQRLYDVIPCELVQNVPTNVQEALYERYQFIVVEQGKASADLTVARRTCCVCHDWCARYIQSLWWWLYV